MPLPEELVKAVAVELHDIFGGKIGYCHHENSVLLASLVWASSAVCEQDAPRLVAAVLRALPESDVVRHAMVRFLLDEAWGGRWSPLDETNLQPLVATTAPVVLAAIARLADDA